MRAAHRQSASRPAACARAASIPAAVAAIGALAGLVLLPQPARAWGAQGHRLIARLAIQSLPATLPAFLHDEDAVDTVEALSVMPDRLKGAGASWDHDRDPGHFLDLGDDGRVAGAVALASLPPDREAYDTALRAAGTDQYKMGFLPYQIVDGWQQIVRDLAQWRAADVLANRTDQTDSDRRLFARERTLWASMAIHDIGIWSHFVGDGSQPLHVTVHFNGWGSGPNPNGYTTDHIHAPFETGYLEHNITVAAVRSAIPAPGTGTGTGDIFAETQRYLGATAGRVDDVYRLYKAGDFVDGNPQAIGLEVTSLAAGAGEMRDLITAAWAATDHARIGYPAVPLADILAGRATIRRDDIIGGH